LKLAPLVFVRPGELRHAEWAEIDLDKAEWRIPAEKMKMKNPHIVPLSSQAVEVLREILPIAAGLGLGKQWFKQFPFLIIYEALVFSHWAPLNSLIHKNTIKV